jgi:hypothetical protein
MVFTIAADGQSTEAHGEKQIRTSRAATMVLKMPAAVTPHIPGFTLKPPQGVVS